VSVSVAVAGYLGREFVVEFVDEVGSRRVESLAACRDVSFERVLPVRRFGWPRGGRSFPGWWWFATTGCHVGFESWLERDRLMLLDFDPVVVGVAAQPFWLRWRDSRRGRRHAPDFFARLADGRGVVVDVRADDRVASADAEKFAVTAQVCARMGWLFRRLGVPDRVETANVRWLSRYRHRRHGGDGRIAERLLGVFAVPTPLFEGVLAVGDRLAVLPVLFHLLWCRRLVADLRGVLLGPVSLVGPARGVLS
jgi:hypothetical protein